MTGMLRLIQSREDDGSLVCKNLLKVPKVSRVVVQHRRYLVCTLHEVGEVLLLFKILNSAKREIWKSHRLTTKVGVAPRLSLKIQ